MKDLILLEKDVVAWRKKNINWIQNCMHVRERVYKQPKYEWKSRIQDTGMNPGSGDSGRHSINEMTKIHQISHILEWW